MIQRTVLRRYTPLAALAALATLGGAACSGGGGGAAAPAPIAQPTVDANASTLEATPTAGIAANGQSPSAIVVALRTTAGQPAAGIAVRLTASGGAVLTPSDLTTDSAGRASASLTSTTAGLVQISAVAEPGTNRAVTLNTTATVTFDPVVTNPGTATIVAAPRFEDRNGNGVADDQDRIVVRFSEPVAVQTSRPDDFALLVNGDSLGSNPSVRGGTRPDEVEIVLGSGANLRTRGAFAPQATDAGQPSGLDVAAGAQGIVAIANGTAAIPSTPRDLTPGLVEVLGVGSGIPADIAFGDLDADGDVDAVLGTSAANAILIQGASGALAFSGVNAGSNDTRAVAVGDLNRVGGDDIVATRDGTLEIYINNSNANGALSLNGPQELAAGSGEALIIADIDGDGFRDIVVGSADGVRVFTNGRNLGATFSLAQTESSVLNCVDLAAGDVDGDGDTDLVAATQQAVTLLRNNGGVLTASSILSTASTGVSLGDFDGDRVPDLSVGDGQSVSVLLGDGAGGFAPSGASVSAIDGELTDVDGDSRADLVVRRAAETVVYRNSAGNLEAVQTIDRAGVTKIVATEFERDGDADLALVAATGARVLTGSVTGTFGSTVLSGTPNLDDATCIARGDLDGDGDEDVVLGRDGEDRVLFNDGNNGFSFSGNPAQTLGDGLASGVALGDVDGDGDLDAVIVERFDPAQAPRWRAWFNDGAGNFDAVSRELPHQATEDARCVVLGDLTGDGADNVVVGAVGANKVFRLANINGTPTFFEFPAVFNAAANTRDTRALALYDIDGEGDLDLVAANYGGGFGEANQVFRLALVNGEPSYSEFALQGNEPSVGVAVGDFDHDTLVDVVFANEDNGQNFQHQVQSFGRRSTQAVGQPIRFTSGSPATSIAAADVNGDGFDDLIMGTADDRLQVWTQTAPLVFTVTQDTPQAGIRGVVAGDGDGDGDVDAIAAATAGSIVLTNR